MNTPPSTSAVVDAQAKLHHRCFLGLQLMVSVQEGPEVIGDWMFRLFRRQHEDKFLSSFSKLGLGRSADLDPGPANNQLTGAPLAWQNTDAKARMCRKGVLDAALPCECPRQSR